MGGRWAAVSRASAAVGGVVWALVAVATLAGRGVGEIGVALTLAVLVTVPLGLGLVAPTEGLAGVGRIYRIATMGQPIAALFALASFALPTGTLAGLLALPWLIETAIVALVGLGRFWGHRFARAEEVAIDAGLGSLVVGGGWLCASRAGLPLGGFSEPIVSLTAAHFHYAGFGALLLAGLAGRHWPVAPALPRRLLRLIVAGIIAAIPLVALAISDLLPEPPGAFLLTVCLLALSGVVATLVRRLGSPVARGLLLVSALAPLLPMALACAYTLRDPFPMIGLTIPLMVRFHGLVNAIGFVLCGLLAWTLAGMGERTAPPPRHPEGTRQGREG
ncbi:MAG TPA: YndJ family transporter [Thermomicrobiales bacterium]|jgi:hypothetical protein